MFLAQPSSVPADFTLQGTSRVSYLWGPPPSSKIARLYINEGLAILEGQQTSPGV